MSRAPLLLWLVWGMACGGSHVQRLHPAPPPVPLPEGSEDALELRLEAAALALRDQGFARVGPSARGFLPSNGRATRLVSIPARTCARFVAVATPSVVDLDASLYRSDGTPLLEDDGSDARPSLTLCAKDTRIDAYYAIHAYQGVGAYATQQFTRPSIEADDLLTVGDEADASELNELAKTLHKRGFEDAGPRVETRLLAGQPLRVGVSVRAGDCYTLAAESSAPLQGVTLRLLDGAQELGNGVATGRLASLQYCSDRPRELSLEVRAASGEGALRIGRFRAAQAAVGGPHAMWLGEPSPSPDAWQQAKQQALIAQQEARADKGALVAEYALAQGEIVEFEAKAPLGECERWSAFLRPGLSRATLLVEGVDGSTYGRAESEGMLAEVSYCGRRGAARVILLGRAGFGSVDVIARGMKGP